MEYKVVLDEEKQAALDKLVESYNSEPREDVTPGRYVQLIVDERLDPVVEGMRAARVAAIQPLGEILVQLPQDEQVELVTRLREKAREHGIDTSSLDGKEAAEGATETA